MTRLWETLQLITVDVEKSGLLRSFKWNGTAYAIVEVANQWRVDTGWWLKRVRRDYYLIATKSGVLAVIYHDLLTDRWYLQEIYD